MQRVNFTEEQLDVINAKERVVFVSAVAGAGKTTTLKEVARVRSNKRILYLVFNKSAQIDAKKAFKGLSNVFVSTVNSLAYQAVGKPYKDVLIHGQYTAIDIIHDLNLSNEDFELADKILFAWNEFLNSSCVYEDYIHQFISDKEMVPYVQRLFRGKRDRVIGCEHDFYMKLYSMTMPDLSINYDVVLFDEVQDCGADASNVMNYNILHSNIEQFFFVGDPYQNIYSSFAGTVNLFDYLSHYGAIYPMTKSQRVGSYVSSICKNIFGRGFRMTGANENQSVELKEQGLDDDEYSYDGRKCFIVRNNGEAFKIAVDCWERGMTTHFIGGVESYRLKDSLKYWWFMKTNKSTDSFLSKFESWKELVRYAKETDDKVMLGIMKICYDHKMDLPQVVQSLIENDKPESEAEVMVVTAHKSKGMDIDGRTVIISPLLLPNEEDDEFEESQRLLYVALTRMKRGRMIIPEEMKDFLGIE